MSAHTVYRRLGVRGFVLLAVCLAALPAAAQVDLGSDAQRADGKQLYDKYCAQCHGVNGDGEGYATYRVQPRPRDFTSGKYKFRTTPNGKLPTDEDVKKVIRDGLPYTSMPGWSERFTETQIQNLVYYLKTFSDDFQDPERYGQPINIPQPTKMTQESVDRGREVYVEQGCGACHGDLGRGNGISSPTLVDDWGHSLRPVDMTKRWTFRGGPSRQDIYRTFSTGVNGTPMPSFADSLTDEDRWHLVNYIYSLGDGDDPGYAELVEAVYVEDDLDTENLDELFANAPKARFPLLGQITQPGRNFYPSLESIEVRAVYNHSEIGFLLTWHDMRAETAGTNDPTLPVPMWDEDNDIGAPAEAAEEDIWGMAVQDEEEESGDFWGEEDSGGDIWGDETGATGGSEFSDAVALQFPSTLPSGNRKPYFIFGDVQSAVDLWFVDLARPVVQQMVGRGSDSLTPAETDDIQVSASYDNGQWSVFFKRELKSANNVTFEQGVFSPMALSVWDGANRERGNKRALSQWFYVYVRPAERVSPVGPMLRAAGIVLLVELIGIFLIRRRHATPSEAAQASGGAMPEPRAAK